MVAATKPAIRSRNGNGESESVDGLTPSQKRHLNMLEKRIERGLSVFKEVGEALMEIRDQRLYRETHTSFEAYCRARWQFERTRAYQLIGAVEVVRALPKGAPPIMNEAQARELVPLARENPKLVEEVWRQVNETGEPITAPLIRQVVRQHLKAPAPVKVSPTAKLVSALQRCEELFMDWKAGSPSKADRKQVEEAVNVLLNALHKK